MASKSQALAFLLFALSTLSLIINTSHATDESTSTTPGIAVYWGQNGNEGALREACATQNYDIVLLAFLNVFGSGRTPNWNFAGHCGDWLPCNTLASDIQYCQSLGVKVFLSLGGGVGDYSLSSTQDANEVGQYLYENFLSGQYGPLGSVSLDGIDFDIEGGGSNLYYDDLARAINAFSTTERKIYLSAAPQCPYPDYYLDAAIKTGLFDYVWVQFYNNPPCQYSNGNANNLLNYWDTWTSAVLPNNILRLGLPAASDAAGSGYVSADVVKSQILPTIKQTPNYGGVMLWSRYYDIQTDFSGQIKGSIGSALLKSVAALADAMYECVTKTLHRFYHVPKAVPLKGVV